MLFGVGRRMPTNDLSLLRPEALAQLGTLLVKRTNGPEYAARPQHLYIERCGHTDGHALGFHLIAFCGW